QAYQTRTAGHGPRPQSIDAVTGARAGPARRRHCVSGTRTSSAVPRRRRRRARGSSAGDTDRPYSNGLTTRGEQMANWTGLLKWAIVFHLFGVIVWIGNLLVIASMLSLVTEEVGAARERLVLLARRLFQIGCNLGALATVFFGIVLILLDPTVLTVGWLH